MHASSYAPSERLRPFVRAFVVVETIAAAPSALLPAPHLVAAFRYRGSAEQLVAGGARPIPDAAISGVATALRRLRTSANGGVIVAQFRAAGAAAFFEAPLHELAGATFDLDALVSRAALAELTERLAAAATLAARVALVDDFLWARYDPQRAAPDPLVARAVAAIHSARGAIRIGALAKQLGISRDPLEKRFRRTVGASPKQLASIVRLASVIAAYRPGASLTQLAYAAGYFDQSHFIHDFRAATGDSPERFLRTTAFW